MLIKTVPKKLHLFFKFLHVSKTFCLFPKRNSYVHLNPWNCFLRSRIFNLVFPNVIQYFHTKKVINCAVLNIETKERKSIQWTLYLRKILGVTKIFLKSRFFLISNTRKPLKKHNFANWTSETIQCLIALSAYDYICRYFHPLIRKIRKCGNIFFEYLKIWFFFLKLL